MAAGSECFMMGEEQKSFHYGIRVCRIQGSLTDSRTKAQRVLGVTRVYWEKPMSHIG